MTIRIVVVILTFITGLGFYILNEYAKSTNCLALGIFIMVVINEMENKKT